MGRSHCCGNACQANLTKYSGATGKIQWQKALFGDGFINSNFSAPNSPADVISVVTSTTAGLLWVVLIERRDAENRPRLLLVESATGIVRKVAADCFPAGVTPTFLGTTDKASRFMATPLTGGGVAVFGRQVNSGTDYKVMRFDGDAVLKSTETITYTPSLEFRVRLHSDEQDTLYLGYEDYQDGLLLQVQQGAFVTTGAATTVSTGTGLVVSSKSVTGGIQAGCVAGTGYALARATANEILICNATLGTTATISANVTSGGAVMAGDASRFVAACDRVRYYDTAGTQQWSELVPSNGFTSIALDASGDVYVGSVRGNVRTEGTTINGF